MQINHAMATLFGDLSSQNLLFEKTGMMAVFSDDPEITPVDSLRSAACSPIPDNAEMSSPLQAMELFDGNYATLEYQGPYADMKDAYQ